MEAVLKAEKDRDAVKESDKAARAKAETDYTNKRVALQKAVAKAKTELVSQRDACVAASKRETEQLKQVESQKSSTVQQKVTAQKEEKLPRRLKR